MSLLHRTLGRPKKPGKHPVAPATEWEWVLDGVRHLAPMWSGAGGVRLYAPTLRETMGLNSGVTWSRGPEGRALDFSSPDAFLATTAAYDWSQPYTILGLMSFDDLTADHAMAGSEQGGGGNWQFQCWMDAGNTNFAIATDGGSGIQVADGGTPNTTDRFLFGISFDGTDTFKLWVDGENLGSIIEANPANPNDVLNIGAANTVGSKQHDGRYFVSYHWGRELPASRHRQLARDPFGPFRMARPTMVVVPAVPETLQRSTKLEASRTNNLTQSEDFSHADWTKSNVTVTADAATAPDGATTADNLSDTASGAHGFVSQAHTVADDSLDDAASVHLEKKLSAHIAMIGLEYSGGTGLVYEAEIDLLTGETDTANSPDAPTRVVVEDWDTFWRVAVVGANNGTGNTTATAKVYPHVGSTLGTRDVSVTGDADAWGVQLEDGAFPSSYIETTSSAVTRAADDASEDFTSAPQEMTVYCKFVETGQAFQGTAGDIWAIGDHSAGPSWRLEGTGPDGQLKLFFDGPSNADQLVFDAGGIGDVVEFRSVLRATDEMEQGVAINGDPESTYGPQSLTDGIPSSWGGDTIFLARRSNSAGFADLLALTISSGVKTMSEMRSLADSKAGDLYSYYPGDTGLTFSRASVATHRRATRELATAASGELRDFHYVARRVGGEVQITASARVAIQSEVSDSASARVASRAERAETASLRAALRGEASELASLRTALRGEQSEDASLRAALRGATSEAGSADVAQTGEQSEVVSLRAALAGAVAEAASMISALAGQLSGDATVRAALREAVAAVSSMRAALQSEVNEVASLRAALRAERLADASMRITTVQEGEVTSAASIRASVQGEAAVLSAVRAALLGETAVDVSALIAAVAERQAAATGRIERVDQILRPNADVANPDAWVNELGATTELWQSLDEVVPDHSDWIEGPP